MQINHGELHKNAVGKPKGAALMLDVNTDPDLKICFVYPAGNDSNLLLAGGRNIFSLPGNSTVNVQ